MMTVYRMEGTRDYNDYNDEHPDTSHIPNDQPIPSQYPERSPNPIPRDEPSEPEIPGPIQAPVREPGRKPKIRVLNIEH